MDSIKRDSELILPEKCNGGGVDRISQLPDEIIIEILSSLSLKERVCTGALSRRWSDLWKDASILKLESFNFVKLVKSVCQSEKGALSLKQFIINLVLNTRSGSSELRIATKWIEFAFLRPVERFELDFKFLLAPRYGCSVILEELLGKSSISLMSSRCVLKSSLKELRLAKLKVRGKTVEMFLRNCPLLEVLIIHDVDLRSDVEVRGGGALKHLDILHCNYSRSDKAIKVSAPNLITYLRIDDDSTWPLLPNFPVDFRFKTDSDREDAARHFSTWPLSYNFPKLVEADFVFTTQFEDVAQVFSRAVFSCVSQLQSLTISLKYLHFTRGFPEMPRLKKLVLKYYGVNDDDDDLEPLPCLIWASPCLEEFKLEVINYNGGFRDKNGRPPTGHRHLKVFEFVGFEGNRCKGHMEVVKCISDNCDALDKIIIRPNFHPFRVAETEATMEFAKQELPPKLPSHIELIVASVEFSDFFSSQ